MKTKAHVDTAGDAKDEATGGPVAPIPHTEGPWVTEDTTLDIVRGIVSAEEVNAIQVSPKADDNHAIAYVPSDYKPKRARANANLIAAAPDLFVALKALVLGDPYGGMYHCRFCSLSALLGHTDDCAWKFAKAAIAKAEGRQP
jgi:hypothetical protein